MQHIPQQADAQQCPRMSQPLCPSALPAALGNPCAQPRAAPGCIPSWSPAMEKGNSSQPGSEQPLRKWL